MKRDRSKLLPGHPDFIGPLSPIQTHRKKARRKITNNPPPRWPDFMNVAAARLIHERGGFTARADPVEQIAAEIVRGGEGEAFLKSVRRGRSTPAAEFALPAVARSRGRDRRERAPAARGSEHAGSGESGVAGIGAMKKEPTIQLIYLALEGVYSSEAAHRGHFYRRFRVPALAEWLFRADRWLMIWCLLVAVYHARRLRA